MAKRTYDELLKEYGLERKETDFERDMKTCGSKIQAGIEAAKKRNAELAKDVDKRRAEYEAKQKASNEAKQKASAKSTAVVAATTVRHHRGGGATAEVDTERIARLEAANKAKSQTPKKTSKQRRVLSSSDSEAQKERASEGARKTRDKLRRGLKRGKARYDENARIMANWTRLFGALRPGNAQSRRKRGLRIDEN